MVQYAERAGLDEENSETFIPVMREMDAEYLKWYEKKLAVKTPKKGTPQHGRFRRTGHNRPDKG